MRAPAILLVAGLVAMAEGGLRAKPRTLQRQQKQTLLAAGAATQDCGDQLLSCTDCSTVLQCTKLGTFYRPVRTTQCPVDTPYCSAGVCVASLPDESCVSAPPASNSFVCNGDGYFPDPGDCHQYWMCVDGKAYQYSCSNFANTVYSQQAAMCVPRYQRRSQNPPERICYAGYMQLIVIFTTNFCFDRSPINMAESTQQYLAYQTGNNFLDSWIFS